MSYLFEINDNCLGKFDNHKYWIYHHQFISLELYSDYIIECRTDGSFFYIKNRYDHSTEVLPRDGSYNRITLQILKSKQYMPGKEGRGTAGFYAPYVPLTIVSVP